VGYRWYDARDIAVSFPFGHGLSYTTFDYTDVAAHATPDGVALRLTVTNSGHRSGAEVVQAYVSLPGSALSRAPRALAGFAKVFLEPGESREVEIVVDRSDLAYWETRTGGWVVEGGDYVFELGASSRDIRQIASVAVDGDAVAVPLTRESTIGEVMANPVAGPIVLQAMTNSPTAGLVNDPSMFKMMASFPIGRLANFPGMPIDDEQVDQLIALANG